MHLYRKELLLRAIDNLDVNIARSSQDYAEILQGCITLKALEEGRRVHACLTIRGIGNNTFTGNKLINMYAKCGSMIDAKGVFGQMSMPDVISWTSIIGGCAHHGLEDEAFATFQKMKKTGVSPNRVTFLCILDALDSVADLGKGQMVHSDIIENALDSDMMIETAVINMYSKAGSIEDACNVFDKMSGRDLISCTAMISALTQHGRGTEALRLFEQMVCEGIEPNEYTITSILCVCATLIDLMQGRKVHVLILVTSNIKENGFVGAALVNMYAKCGSTEQAHLVFERLGERDVTSWTALITGYAHNGVSKAALELFQQMQVEGLEADVVIGNSLIHLFSKCGNLIDARGVFDNMLRKDIISWSTLISGYAQQGFSKDAIDMFWQMLEKGVLPDEFTVSSILAACANLTTLVEGMEVHAYIIEFELDSDTFVRNGLVNLYIKCGSMQDAHVIFNCVPNPQVESWNAMILGYGQQEYGKAAHEMFESFLRTSSEPDEYTFSAVLSACASLGMLAESKEVHDLIIRTGFELNNIICNALIDMYATCGSLKEAFAVFTRMTERDLISWSSMIGGWAQHGYGTEAVLLYQQMQQEGVMPDESTLSSILTGCSYAGLVKEGWFWFESMRISHGIFPSLKHYVCMVDLLGRSGSLYEAAEFTHKMPIQPHCSVWMSLLAACRSHDNMQLADHVASYAFDFGSRSSGAYILLSNIYAVTEMGNGLSKDLLSSRFGFSPC